MGKLISLLAAFLMVSCTFHVKVPPAQVMQQPAVQKEETKYDINRAFDSVGRISAKVRRGVGRLSGTAFAYDKDTLLTAAHVCVSIYELQMKNVLEDNIQLTYLNRNNKPETKDGIEILEVDEPHDLCLVSLKDHGLKPLKMAKYRDVEFGDKVYVVGAPAGFLMSAKEGRVMDKWSSGHPIPILNKKLIVDAPATGGNSGGPILNENGEVIGLLVMGHATYDHLTIAVPSSVVKRFLRLVGK